MLVPAALAAITGIQARAEAFVPVACSGGEGDGLEALLAFAITVGIAAVATGIWTSSPVAADPPGKAVDPARPPRITQRPTVPVDRQGDPLPLGAIARFGSDRWRHEGEAETMSFSPDGKFSRC